MNSRDESGHHRTIQYHRMGTSANIIRGIAVFMMFIVLVMPNSITSSYLPATVSEPTSKVHDLVGASNYIRVNLPYPVHALSVGRTYLGPGLVYIHNDLLRFYNPVTNVADSVEIGSASPILETLTSADIDADGRSEFIFVSFSIIESTLHVVDFDTHTDTKYPISIMGDMIEILTGDFDDNGVIDFALYNPSSLFIFNGINGSLIRDYYFTDIVRACSGDFHSSVGDEIAVLYNSPAKANIDVVDGSGIKAHTEILLRAGKDITPFQYGDGQEDLAVITYDVSGLSTTIQLDALSGNLSLVLFSVNNELIGRSSYLGVGDFNDDTQEDLVVVSSPRAMAWFVNGDNGHTLRMSTDVCLNNNRWRTFATAKLDSDHYSDLAIEGAYGQLAFIRGVNGRTGYEEPRAIGPFNQIVTYDINDDGRSDILTLTDKIAILLGDTEPPQVSYIPVYPSHPTLYDSHVKFELIASDNLKVSNATIYIRKATGQSMPIYDRHPMIGSAGGRFIYLMTDLTPCTLQYYIEVVDPYLNMFMHGNSTSPKTLTVEGHAAWGVNINCSKTQGKTHALALGNLSTGERTIHTVAVDTISNRAILRTFHSDGRPITEFEITRVPDISTSIFEVYSGLLDDDGILDPVVIYSKSLYTTILVFRGNGMTLWQNRSYLMRPVLQDHILMLFDDDGDGRDELHYIGINITGRYLVRAESLITQWQSIILPGDASVVAVAHASLIRPYSHIGILRDDNTLHIYQANDLLPFRVLSYSSPGSTMGDTAFDIDVCRHASHPADQFLVTYTGWSDDTAVTYLCLVNNETSFVGAPPYYQVFERHPTLVEVWDTDRDGTDEFLFYDHVGYLSLLDTSYVHLIRWSRYVRDAIPQSNIIMDFDGDSLDEFVVATSDDYLTAIGRNGEIDYQTTVGMLFNMMNIGNVDAGLGEDIAAFPIYRYTDTLAVIRNIDLFYVLNVSILFETDTILQGVSMWANVTILDVFDEPVPDAFVTLTTYYMFGNKIVGQNFGPIYSNTTQQYTATITPNWPMGMVNVSLNVKHTYYDTYNMYIVNAFRVESVLSISVFVPQETAQGGYLPVNITVTDLLGTRVADADVNVTLNGRTYHATYDGERYHVLIPLVNIAVGEHSILVVADHPYSIHAVEQYVKLVIVTSDLVIIRQSPAFVEQDKYFVVTLNITDQYGNPLTGASVIIDFGIDEASMREISPGHYFLNEKATLPVGNYSCKIRVEHPFVRRVDFGAFHMGVRGQVHADMQASRPFVNYEEQTFNFAITDQYGNPVSGFTYHIRFADSFTVSGVSEYHRFSWRLYPNISCGRYVLNITITGTYVIRSSQQWWIELYTTSQTLVVAPVQNANITQGEYMRFKIYVIDAIGNHVPDCSLRAIIRTINYMLTDHGNGTYTLSVITAGWSPGIYAYILLVSHDLFEYSITTGGEVNIIGRLMLDINLSTITPLQNSNITVSIRVTDIYYNTVTGAYVRVRFVDKIIVVPESTSPGIYETQIMIGSVPHGRYNITVYAEHDICIATERSISIYVSVRPPAVSLDTPTFASGLTISFLVSLIGLMIYFKISSSIAVADMSSHAAERSIRRMDLLYASIIAAGLLILTHSVLAADSGQYALAVAESVLLLGVSVLLYGIWLYRDANHAIVRGRGVSKTRMILGIWHLIFVPLVIIQIFSWGAHIEWFQFYVLESTFSLGPFNIPTIMITIFATYVSSIGIVVINLYREMRSELARIDRMIVAGTPEAVVAYERLHLVSKMGSSIRVKFFMFLVVLAGTTAMTMDFLRSYSLGVIVLMPVLFLIIVPYISSRLLRGASRVSNKMRERRVHPVGIQVETEENTNPG